jgi:hypothetical protein
MMFKAELQIPLSLTLEGFSERRKSIRKEALRFSVYAGADPFRHYRRKPSRLEENLPGWKKTWKVILKGGRKAE